MRANAPLAPVQAKSTGLPIFLELLYPPVSSPAEPLQLTLVSGFVDSIFLAFFNFLVAFFFVAMCCLPVGKIAPWGGHDVYMQKTRECKTSSGPLADI